MLSILLIKFLYSTRSMKIWLIILIKAECGHRTLGSSIIIRNNLNVSSSAVIGRNYFKFNVFNVGRAVSGLLFVLRLLMNKSFEKN